MTAKVKYTLRCFDGLGNEVTEINDGKEFDLVLFAQDLRPEGEYNYNGDIRALLRGVYAAYVDVLYNEANSPIKGNEVQTISFTSRQRGTVKFTANNRISRQLSYNVTTGPQRELTRLNLQSILDELLGKNVVTVKLASNNSYNVNFLIPGDVHELKSNNPLVKVAETFKGLVFFDAFKFSPQYQNGKSARDDFNAIRGLGAFFSGNTSLGAGIEEVEVVRVRMVAKLMPAQNIAIQNFVLDLSKLTHPMDDTLVMGNWAANPPENSDVEPFEIVCAGTSLRIVR